MKHVITWGELVAFEPSVEEVARIASELVAGYNDPRNASLLGHTSELVVADVIEHYAKLSIDAHPFLLTRREELAGDADLRGVANGSAEFAFLIATPSAQGKGLGTRFATMIHAFAFRTLDLERVYASVVPANVASRRVFEKLGYVDDDAAEYGDEGDVVLRLDRTTFEQRHVAALADIAIAVR